MTVRHVRVDSKAGFDYHWKGLSHYVALHDLQNIDSETFSDGHTVIRRRDLRGRLTFIPAGCAAWGWSIPAKSRQAFTALYLDPADLEAEVSKKLANLPLASEIYFANLALRSTLEKLQQSLSANVRPDAMYLESLCVTAMLELCIFRRETDAAAALPAGHLAKSLQERLFDYVEVHLGEDIGLSDLARIAGLSRFHFSRAFKNTTGQTPYRFLLERRIAAAQRLMKSGTLSIAEIATATGLKDPNRLHRTFRKIVGTTLGGHRAS